jgi:hypothetical protein
MGWGGKEAMPNQGEIYIPEPKTLPNRKMITQRGQLLQQQDDRPTAGLQTKQSFEKATNKESSTTSNHKTQ